MRRATGHNEEMMERLALTEKEKHQLISSKSINKLMAAFNTS
jgi:hypothetical protein